MQAELVDGHKDDAEIVSEEGYLVTNVAGQGKRRVELERTGPLLRRVPVHGFSPSVVYPSRVWGVEERCHRQ